MPERALQACGQGRAREGKRIGKHEQIVKIFHTTIGRAERQDRLRLLGHRALSRIGGDHWRRMVEQYGKLRPCRRRQDHVTETDVDLHRNPRCPKQRVDPDCHAPVGMACSDLLGLERGFVESDRVGRRRAQNLADGRCDLLHGCPAWGMKIDIPCGASTVELPEREKRRALEHEATCMGRGTEPVEKPLGHEFREHRLKIRPSFRGDRCEPCPHGIGAVRIAAHPCHARLSRYGRITRSTRSTRA